MPTLAALWPSEQLSGIRLLILGGEACPEKLAHRLAQACTEVWNTYGPTETTVVACAAQMHSDEPVRIGLPLDGWHLAVVDPATGVPVEAGGIGELVIGGVGTARYLDREKDAAKFTSLLALDWDRAYRSGDLVRADPEGLSFVGRADTQVKIRGFRIELSEIEAVLLQMPGVGQAVVSTYESAPGLTELVAYYSPVPGSAVDAEGIRTTLRNRLPGHMVPGYVEELAEIPMMTSGKADRKALPPPRRRSGGASPEAYVAPADRVETVLAEALAEIVGLDKVSVESHFFDDLGANSLMLAHFCAQVRKAGGLPPVAMQDVYQNPTVRSLAAALPKGDAPAPVAVPEPAAVPPVGTLSYVFCGLMQLLVMLGLVALGAVLVDIGLRWVWPATDPVQIFVRTSALSTATLARVRPPAGAGQVAADRPVEAAGDPPLEPVVPAVLGREDADPDEPVGDVRRLPALPDVPARARREDRQGRDDLLHDRAGVHGHAQDRVAHRDPRWRVVQRLPRRRRGDPHRRDHDRRGRRRRRGHRADLGDRRWATAPSSGTPRRCTRGQSIPAGERWHGSPARPTDIDFGGVDPARCGSVRRFLYSCRAAVQPAGARAGRGRRPWSGCCSRSPTSPSIVGPGPLAAMRGGFYLEQLALAAAVLFGGFLLGLLYVATVPRRAATGSS